MFVNKDTLKYDTKSIENDFVSLIRDLSIDNKVILLPHTRNRGKFTKKFENMVRVFNYSYSDFLDQNAEVLNFF